MKPKNMIIEIGSYQLCKHGNTVCGDTFLSCKIKNENRFIAVLSDGLGSGIKANVLSSMTASMAIGFRLHNTPVIELAKSIMDTLPVDSIRNISYSTFSIIDVDFDGETYVAEYGNPSFLIWRNGKPVQYEKEKIEVMQNEKKSYVLLSKCNLKENDRLIVVTDGITQSGIGNAITPFGWGNEGLSEFMAKDVDEFSTISASDLSRTIVMKAQQNDAFRMKDDASCAVIYRRVPRRLLLCSGPPYSESRDKYLGERIAEYKGKIILCGGTTAKIVSRELNREIVCPPIEQMKGDLPPVASMAGVDLISEGILTLGKVLEILENIKLPDITERDPAASIVRYLLNADIIDIIVGTRINEAHQDPNLPVELEIRRSVMKRIINCLETKFLKQINVQFI
ncbi:MAG TPA: SpoIIE family protein phosphatase [Bacteroidales bacterium]|nr:SpoIIE family protein phosphatase [Bacteroidales bacterium]